MSSDKAALETSSGNAPAPFLAPETQEELWGLFLRRKSQATREKYRYDLQCFSRFAGEGDDYKTAVERLLNSSAPAAYATIESYIGHMTEQQFWAPDDDPSRAPPIQIGYAPATIRRRVYALRSVTDFARSVGMVDWDLRGIKMPRAENIRDTRGCTRAEFDAIIDTLGQALEEAEEQDDKATIEVVLRDTTLVRLLHDSGLRRAEAVGIGWPADVILDDKPRVRIRGKGKVRLQWKPVSRLCAPVLEQYVTHRRFKKGHLLASVHPRNRGGKLDLSTVNRRIDYWGKQAGVRVTPHGLRHLGATEALRKTGGDYRRTMMWSRHQDPRTLAIYDDGDEVDHDRAITDLIA